MGKRIAVIVTDMFEDSEYKKAGRSVPEQWP